MHVCLPCLSVQEVSEDDKGYSITAEVPGFDKKDIKVRACVPPGAAGIWAVSAWPAGQARLVYELAEAVCGSFSSSLGNSGTVVCACSSCWPCAT